MGLNVAMSVNSVLGLELCPDQRFKLVDMTHHAIQLINVFPLLPQPVKRRRHYCMPFGA